MKQTLQYSEISCVSYRHFSRFPDSFPDGALVLASPHSTPQRTSFAFFAVQLEDCLLFRKIFIRNSQNRRNSGIERILKMEVVIVEIN